MEIGAAALAAGAPAETDIERIERLFPGVRAGRQLLDLNKRESFPCKEDHCESKELVARW
jgi:hypothetical protein